MLGVWFSPFFPPPPPPPPPPLCAVLRPIAIVLLTLPCLPLPCTFQVNAMAIFHLLDFGSGFDAMLLAKTGKGGWAAGAGFWPLPLPAFGWAVGLPQQCNAKLPVQCKAAMLQQQKLVAPGSCSNAAPFHPSPL